MTSKNRLEASLPRAAYADPAFFERERRAIFWDRWFYVGRAEQFDQAGAFRVVDVAGESVIIVRGQDGELHAHLNLCRHRGSRLLCGDGVVRGAIRCPYHAWAYALDGTLIASPFVEPGDVPPDARRLHRAGVACWAGFVFVNLQPEDARRDDDTLAAQLGPVPARLARYPLEDLKVARSIRYAAGANWKVILENYNECYHCAGVHPELCAIVPAFKRRGGAALDWERGIPHRAGAWTFSWSGTSDRAPFPGLDADERVRHKGELIYPNFMLSLAADHAAAFSLWPQSPEKTAIVCDFLFHPEEMAKPGFDPSDAIDFWDLVNKQDWAICESVQAGMRSRAFAHGYYAPMEDSSLDIRRYIAARLGDDAVAIDGGERRVNDEFDAIVLGLGGIGSGAAYWLAKRGARVLGLEQFDLGHARGESHDHSRIIRLSYVSQTYVRLSKEAYRAWESVERDAGERLIFRTGGLDLGPRDGAIPMSGYADAMRAGDVPFEWLDASAIRARWPAFQVGDDVCGLFQADGGIVAAERATAAHQRAARAFGAVLRDRAPVTSLRAVDGEIEVEAGGERYRAAKLIVAAGPWSARALAAFGVRLPLEVTKEQAMYFKAREIERFAFGRFPVWIWMDDPSFYGFPVFGEAGAVKVTQDAGGLPVDADTRGFDEDPAITARVTTFLKRYLPGALGPAQLVKTCLYTLTPDRDFVIDRLPEHPNVSVAIGAGHAFKFASVIGRILSELALDGATGSAIGDFRIQRPILTLASPPKTYMV